VSDYFSFRAITVVINGLPLTVIGKPGVWSWDRLNPGTLALLQAADLSEACSILDLGCGTGVVGLYAAQTGASVVMVDSSLPAVLSARRTAARDPESQISVRLADGVQGLAPRSFDVVLSHLPRGRRVQQELIDGAAWSLRPGGCFYFVAHRRAGVKTAIRHARTRFGRCAVVAQKQGFHVAMSVLHDAGLAARPWTLYEQNRVAASGLEAIVVGKPGVFAWDRIDDGTAALIRTMEIEAESRVLDLGCGTGLAGLAAARRAHRGSVVLVDGDVRAVEAARLTVQANHVTNTEALVSDCAQEVHDQRFDVVVTNPPFHRGVGTEYDVAYQFVRDARQVLRRGGRLYLVANQHIPYRSHIEAVFGNATTRHSDNRYQVISADVS
jgi:16S rRNA (guanine1207-N2)-methyltransferase